MKRFYVVNRIQKYFSSLKLSVMILCVISVISVPLQFVSPKLFQLLIDNMTERKNIGQVWYIFAALIVTFLVRLIVDSGNLHFSNRILNTFSLKLREDIWQKFIKIPFQKYSGIDIGDLKMRFMDDVDSLGNFIKEQVIEYFSAILLIVFSSILCFYINIKLTLFCLLILPMIFITDYFIGYKTKIINEEIRHENERYYTFTHESLQLWRHIKENAKEEHFISRFTSFRDRLSKLRLKNMRYWAFSESLVDLKTNYLSKVYVYIIGTFLVIDGTLSVGTLIMHAEFFGILFQSINNLFGKRISLKTNLPYYKKIFELLDMPENTFLGQDAVMEPYDIKIKSIHFSYNCSDYIFKNFSISIEAGMHTVITGKSGSGKSTLLKLICGLYNPEIGCICFGNVNAENLAAESRSENVAIVMQDSFYLNDTIKENLLIAKEDATDIDLMNALKDADLDEFVLSLPEKLETVIGENGIKLSGGQKQRLAIARVVLRDAPIVLFDESTSSLDGISENKIFDMINRKFKGRTVVSVSHKQSVMEKADRIYKTDHNMLLPYSDLY